MSTESTRPTSKGPSLPRPSKEIIDTGAAIEGMFAQGDRWGSAGEAIAELFDVDRDEADARFEAWLQHQSDCWDVFSAWCKERDLVPCGYLWDGDDEPSFFAEPKT